MAEKNAAVKLVAVTYVGPGADNHNPPRTMMVREDEVEDLCERGHWKKGKPKKEEVKKEADNA